MKAKVHLKSGKILKVYVHTDGESLGEYIQSLFSKKITHVSFDMVKGGKAVIAFESIAAIEELN